MTNPGPAITTGNNQQVPAQALRLLGKVIGINANTAATDYVVQLINPGIYSVEKIIFTNASISLTTATAGLFASPGGAGTIAIDAALSALTTSLKVASPSPTKDLLSADNLYVRIGTAQGAAATFDAYLYGFDVNG